VKAVCVGLLALVAFEVACTNPNRCLDDACLPAGGAGAANVGGSGGSGAAGASGGSGGTTAECGNGVVEGNEACDRDAFPTGDACANGLGALLCQADCTLVTSYCNTLCGDGVVDASEICDGPPAQSCDAVYPGATGTLGCNANCLGLDTSLCILPAGTCGDGSVTDAEQCDPGAPLGMTCTDLAATLSGELSCHDNCTFDSSACSRCGNGVRDEDEQCDGESAEFFECAELKYATGVLSCTATCTFDISGCELAL
jgi:hypothetical protein